MGLLRTNRLGKRYSSVFSWVIWILLEMPAMLVAVVFDKTGKLLRWIGELIVRHVYYVFTRFARWVDGKPGWRESDSWIGVPPPPGAADPGEASLPPEITSYFEESRKRGRATLEAMPTAIASLEALSPEARCDVVNAISAMDAPLISAVPKREVV